MMVFERATLRPENVQIGGHFKGQLQQDILDLGLSGFLRSPSCEVDSVVLELLRKEVIQPHLPIRLPCYDLAPIRNLALDA